MTIGVWEMWDSLRFDQSFFEGQIFGDGEGVHLEGVGVHSEVVPHAGLGADRKRNPGRLDHSLLERVE